MENKEFNLNDLDLIDKEATGEEFVDSKHGRIVEVKQIAFYDITVYEDGYEKNFYIGD